MSATEQVSTTATANGGEAPKHEGFRVHLGNLAYSTTEEQVREFLAPAGGEITTVELPLRFKRPAGYAFVGYKSEDEVKKVVEQLDGHDLGERKVHVALARSPEEAAERRKAAEERRAAARATKAQEAKEKKEAAGGATTTDGEGAGAAKPKKTKKKPVSRRRQPGEEGEEGAEEDVNGGEASATGTGAKPKRKPKKPARESRIDADAGEETLVEKDKESKPRRKREPKLELTGEQSKNTIFVANLPFNVDDDALAAIFTNLSISVKSAKVIKGLRRAGPGSRPFRASKGFGFVEVENPDQQKEAVEKVNESLIGDRKISAKVANEMKPIEKAEAKEAAEETTAA